MLKIRLYFFGGGGGGGGPGNRYNISYGTGHRMAFDFSLFKFQTF